jgi:hypothetical protein
VTNGKFSRFYRLRISPQLFPHQYISQYSVLFLYTFSTNIYSSYIWLSVPQITGWQRP